MKDALQEAWDEHAAACRELDRTELLARAACAADEALRAKEAEARRLHHEALGVWADMTPEDRRITLEAELVLSAEQRALDERLKSARDMALAAKYHGHHPLYLQAFREAHAAVEARALAPASTAGRDAIPAFQAVNAAVREALAMRDAIRLACGYTAAQQFEVATRRALAEAMEKM